MAARRQILTIVAVAAVLAVALLLLRGERDEGPRAERGATAVAEQPRSVDPPEAEPQPEPHPEAPPAAKVERPAVEPAPLPAGVLEVVALTRGRGTFVEGARITLVRRDSYGKPTGSPQQATTDEGGEVRFCGLTPAAYRLRFSHPDYAPLLRIVSMSRRNQGVRVAFRLESGARLEVKVAGPRGEPVAGREVVLTQYAEEPRRAPTGVDGMASFDHVKTSHGGRIEVVGAPGGSGLEITLPRGGKRTVEFRLGSLVTGLVVGPDGRPMPGVSVEISRSGQYHRAETDVHSRYRIHGFAPGPASVRARLRGEGGFQTPKLPVEILEGTTEHDIQIGRGEIAGVVRHADTDRPLAHVNIYLSRMKPFQPRVSLWIYTASDGRFAAKGLPPGRYRLQVRWRADFREKVLHVDLAADTPRADLDIPLELKRYGTLLLRVNRADGRPAKGLSFAESQGNRSTSLRVTECAEGVYELKLEAGERTIIVTVSPFHKRIQVRIDAGRTTEKIVRPAQ